LIPNGKRPKDLSSSLEIERAWLTLHNIRHKYKNKEEEEGKKATGLE